MNVAFNKCHKFRHFQPTDHDPLKSQDQQRKSVIHPNHHHREVGVSLVSWALLMKIQLRIKFSSSHLAHIKRGHFHHDDNNKIS